MGLEQTVEDVNKAYVGFEITFSNDDLELMRLTKKEFELNIDKTKKDIVQKIKQLEYDIKELNKIKKKQKKENNVEGEKKRKMILKKKNKKKNEQKN